MDEVRLVLCFGLKEAEEGFINTYTCFPPACSGDAGISERNKNKSDVFSFVFTCLFQGYDCILWASFIICCFIQKVASWC